MLIGGAGGSQIQLPDDTNTVLLLHMDGENNATTFKDSALGGSAPHTLTANGDAKISTTQSKFGGASGYFDGTGDYLTAPHNADFNFASSDFAIEFWIFQTVNNDKYIFSKAAGDSVTGQMVMRLPGTGEFAFLHYGAGESNWRTTSGAGISTNTWYHIAVTRYGSQFNIYVNGTSRVSWSNANAYSSLSADLVLGGWIAFSSYFDGYIDDLRISKGVARYTANFTPPTKPHNPKLTLADPDTVLLLHMDGENNATTFKDSALGGSAPHTLTAYGDAKISTTQSKFGGASLALDGTGDYVTVAANTDFNLNDDWTVEAWIYISSEIAGRHYPVYNSDSDYVMGFMRFPANHGDPLIRKRMGYYASSSGTGWNMLSGDSGTLNGRGTIDIDIEGWYHVAFVRSSGTFYGFVNGVKDIEVAVAGNIVTPSEPKRIGRWGYDNGNYIFAGYIDDIRISKGIARYTANFTPPTRPHNPKLRQ